MLGAVFVAEIGDVSRFASPKALCSWAGLTPKHHESGLKVRRGRITKQGSRMVRWAAIEAVARSHGGPPFEDAFVQIAERRGKLRAHVAIARKGGATVQSAARRPASSSRRAGVSGQGTGAVFPFPRCPTHAVSHVARSGSPVVSARGEASRAR